MAVLAPAGWAAEQVVDSVWATLPIVVDGANSEWLDTPLIRHKASEAEYAVRNNADNLYLLFVFKTRQAMTTIEQTGMSVFFSTAGKKQRDLGLRFVKKEPGAVYAADVFNKKGLPTPSAPSARSDPPDFRYLPGPGMVVYEFRIPLSRLNHNPGGIGAEPGQVIKVGFEWGGWTAEMRQAMVVQRTEGSSQAASNASALGNCLCVGLEDGGGGPGLQRSPKKHAFWIDLKLDAPD
jgi:hypothetical protein